MLCTVIREVNLSIAQIYSGITSGRVLDGELLYTKILEVNLSVFVTDYSMKISLENMELMNLCL